MVLRCGSIGAAFLLLAATHSSGAPERLKTMEAMARDARQLVLVTTPDWDAVDGVLGVYDRETAHAPWRPVETAVPVVVGRSGLGWGVGMRFDSNDRTHASEPLKKEADGKAPAGVFRLTTAFGFASRPGPHASLSFTQITPSVECVDDQYSRFYNRIVDRTKVAVDWKTSEQMSAYGAQYKWGIVVDYNSAPSVAGAGSCIFLHVWSGAGRGTAGCTAMPEKNITKLIDWLSPEKHPVLVQMPRAALSRYGEALRLPPLF